METGEIEVRDTPFHSANLIQEVIDGVQCVLVETPQENTNDTPPVMCQVANAAAQNQMLPQMMTQIMQMMKQIQVMQQNMNSNNPPQGNTNNSGSNNSNGNANNNNNNARRR